MVEQSNLDTFQVGKKGKNACAQIFLEISMEASLSPLHHKNIKWQGNDKMKLTNNTIQKSKLIVQ
jgi:hypothetical protein